MARIVAIADAAFALCRASRRRGIAMTEMIPIKPHTNSMSSRVNPFSLRIIARLSLHGRSCRACAAGRKNCKSLMGSRLTNCQSMSRADTYCQHGRRLTIVATIVSARTRRGYRSPDVLASSHQTLGETVHERAVVGGQIVQKAIDSFDDDAPLREAGDRAERVQ